MTNSDNKLKEIFDELYLEHEMCKIAHNSFLTFPEKNIFSESKFMKIFKEGCESLDYIFDNKKNLYKFIDRETCKEPTKKCINNLLNHEKFITNFYLSLEKYNTASNQMKSLCYKENNNIDLNDMDLLICGLLPTHSE